MENINNSYSSQPATRTELPLALTVEDVMAVLNIGRNAAYNLLRSNQIRSIRIGKQIRVPRQAMLEFLGETA